LIYTPDSEISTLVTSLENEVKSVKHQVYKLSWYMRGGVDAHKLMYETDIEDLSILNKIIDENIETSKKAQMPLI
jgi:hypothetical protein